MSAILLLVIVILLSIALAFGGIVFFRRRLRKQQAEYKARVNDLQKDLAAANAQVSAQAEKFKTVQGTSDYEKYAGRVLAQIDRAVIIIDQSGMVRLINKYAEQYLDLGAAVGQPYKQTFHVRVAGVADDYALFEAALAGKPQPLPDNMELVGGRGTYPLSGTIQPLLSGQSADGIAFIFEDNSKQVARVKEEQAFFSAAAHELRTPITIIRMTVELLRDKFDTLPREKILEHLRRADESSEQMAKLVNDFLSVSRLDQGRLEIKAERFDMATLTDEVIRNLAMLAKERSLYVHHEMEGDHHFVIGDRAKSAEVLTNLISNGLKYTLQGGVTISHKTTATALTTAVTDSGPGIPREMQSLLFKRFGQVGEARSQAATKSTGLGLYISKKLAHLMRGDVVLVSSEPGTGSTFAFTLPLG